MKTISISRAKYVDCFKLELLFNDNKKQIVDFSSFFENNNHPQFNKYKKKENFKKFKIETGNIVWGKDWDMIFPVHDLYKGKIE